MNVENEKDLCETKNRCKIFSIDVSECEFEDFEFIWPLKEYMPMLDQIILPDQMLTKSPLYFNLFTKKENGQKDPVSVMEIRANTVSPAEFLKVMCNAKESKVNELLFSKCCFQQKFIEWHKCLVLEMKNKNSTKLNLNDLRVITFLDCSFEDIVSIWAFNSFSSYAGIHLKTKNFKIT